MCNRKRKFQGIECYVRLGIVSGKANIKLVEHAEGILTGNILVKKPALLPQCQRPGFTPIQNHGQNYKTIILPVILYECETWSLTLREERRLRVFENRVLRRVFGPKRDEVTGD